MPNLKLDDPIEEIRPLFREVWILHSSGRKEEAGELFQEVMRNTVGPLMESHEEMDTPSIRRVLMEEKHRLEDIEEIVRKVSDALKATQSTGSENVTNFSEHVANSKGMGASGGELNATSQVGLFDQAEKESQVAGRQHVANKKVASKKSAAGGLDLAGMIDTMLEDERRDG